MSEHKNLISQNPDHPRISVILSSIDHPGYDAVYNVFVQNGMTRVILGKVGKLTYRYQGNDAASADVWVAASHALGVHKITTQTSYKAAVAAVIHKTMDESCFRVP